MKWFFALNQDAFEFSRYAEMLTVAVHTAARHTTLVPYCLYDGTENALTEWLRSRNVNVVHCRSFLYDRLRSIAAERGDKNILSIGAGALLRVEIPHIAADLHIDDSFALYTDVDVMFIDEVSALEMITPRLFAVAPEFDRSDFVRMNTGVMLMNLGALREQDAQFRRFLMGNLTALVVDSWDQGAFRRFFGRMNLLAKVVGTKWDHLPPEFNWKPHWGTNHKAKIIHFHGPKPQQVDSFLTGQLHEHEKWMIPFATSDYRNFSEMWRNNLVDARTLTTGNGASQPTFLDAASR